MEQRGEPGAVEAKGRGDQSQVEGSLPNLTRSVLRGFRDFGLLKGVSQT